jgi:hypothetical protein
MACKANRRIDYILDFSGTYGKRCWITMPKGTPKKKAKRGKKKGLWLKP